MRRLLNLFFALVILIPCGCMRIRPPRGVIPVERTLEVSGYCKCRKCCGWHRNWYGRPVDNAGGGRKRVGLTADGTMARRGTIAAPSSYPFGTTMYVEGYGYGVVEDRGGAIQGDRIDLFFTTHRQAIKWGRKKVVVKIWFPRT